MKFISLLNSRSQLIDLENACQNMWLAAGNNLITTAGPNKELTVDTTAANPLFTVVPGGGGPGKIASLPFTRFHGNVFSIMFCLLSLLFYSKSPYSPLLSLIDECHVTVCSS